MTLILSASEIAEEYRADKGGWFEFGKPHNHVDLNLSMKFKLRKVSNISGGNGWFSLVIFSI